MPYQDVLYLKIKNSGMLERNKELILTRRHNAPFAADVIKQTLLVICLMEGLKTTSYSGGSEL